MRPVTRRLGILTLTLAVAAAPAVLAACALECLAGDLRQSPSHSCHESQSTGTASITSGVHACGHSEELPVASGQLTTDGGAAPPLAMSAVAPLHPLLATAAFQFPGSTPSPPDRLALTTQLRI